MANQTPPSISSKSKIGLHLYTQRIFPRVVMEPDFWNARNWRRSLVYGAKNDRISDFFYVQYCPNSSVETFFSRASNYNISRNPYNDVVLFVFSSFIFCCCWLFDIYLCSLVEFLWIVLCFDWYVFMYVIIVIRSFELIFLSVLKSITVKEICILLNDKSIERR